MHVISEQQATCVRFGAAVVPGTPNQKIGIALATLGQLPINALRHATEGDVSGWYVWCGEELSTSPDFFQPVHITHLMEYVPEVISYLALPPGWRVLLAPGHEDVWFDESLCRF
jgi:hypothetical protein